MIWLTAGLDAVTIYLLVYGSDMKAHFSLLKNNYKEQVDSQMGMKLDWREVPNGKHSYIETHKKANPIDRSDWPQQHAWIKSVVEKFHRVFAPIVKKLDVSEYQEPDELDVEDNE